MLRPGDRRQLWRKFSAPGIAARLRGKQAGFGAEAEDPGNHFRLAGGGEFQDDAGVRFRTPAGVVGIRAGLPIGSFSRPPRPRLRLGHPSSSEEGSSNPPAPKVLSSYPKTINNGNAKL